MEGLRGFAVLLVFFVHYDALFSTPADNNSLTYRISGLSGAAGNAGVDLFFVVSGYLIYKIVITRKIVLRDFLRRRIQRIYHTFVFAFALYALGEMVFPETGKLDWHAPSALGYLAENLLLLPGIFPIVPIISVAWSLSYELLFYGTLPVIVTLLGLRQWNRRARLRLFTGLILLYAFLAGWGILGYIRVIMFLTGVLLFEASDSGTLEERLSGAGEILVASAFWLSLLGVGWWSVAAPKVTGADPFANSFLVFRLLMLSGTIAGLVLYTFCFDGLLNRMFCLTPTRWLGNMSYSYYLIRGGVLHGFRLLLQVVYLSAPQSSMSFWMLLPSAVALTILATAPVFLLIEKPFSLRAHLALINRTS